MEVWIDDNNKKVICPECKSEGKKSTVKVDPWGMQTLLYAEPESFYDEDGVYHYSPPPKINTATSSATCSNGHKFDVKEKV